MVVVFNGLLLAQYNATQNTIIRKRSNTPATLSYNVSSKS